VESLTPAIQWHDGCFRVRKAKTARQVLAWLPLHKG